MVLSSSYWNWTPKSFDGIGTAIYCSFFLSLIASAFFLLSYFAFFYCLMWKPTLSWFSIKFLACAKAPTNLIRSSFLNLPIFVFCTTLANLSYFSLAVSSYCLSTNSVLRIFSSKFKLTKTCKFFLSSLACSSLIIFLISLYFVTSPFSSASCLKVSWIDYSYKNWCSYLNYWFSAFFWVNRCYLIVLRCDSFSFLASYKET